MRVAVGTRRDTEASTELADEMRDATVPDLFRDAGDAPSGRSRIELHVKRSPGGPATDGWIFRHLAVGDRIPVSGPYGQFSFRPARNEPVLLLATGTGLAPMKSMIQHIEHTGSGHQVVLYHGVSTAADLYEHSWLERFAAEHEWCTYQPALSREEHASEHPFAAKGLAGWVGGRLRPDLDRAGRHGRGGERRVPPGAQ